MSPRPDNPHGASSGPERFLRVDHLSGNLRGRSVRGGAVTLINQFGKFALTLGSTAILARLLTPSDFGLFAMVISIVGFIATFKDMGLAMATVQRADINHAQVSTLFWLSLAISVLLLIPIILLAPVFAWFYKEPRVSTIMIVVAGTVILSGLTIQHIALLRRQMRFGALAIIEITAQFLAVTTAVVCAVSGLGYWSLVILLIVKEFVVMVGVWLACGWRPGRPARRSGVRSLLSFGVHLTGFNIVNYFSRNLDKVLIGWRWGASPLGLYNKAYQLLLLPIQQINTPITSVAVPTLSRLQNQPARYRAYYRRGVMLTVTVGMPIIAFLFVAADKAVLTLLGEQWIDAVAVFRVLAPAAFLGTFNHATGWVYLSLGMTKRQFIWGSLAAVIISAAFVIGLQWGPIGVGIAFSTAIVLLRLPGIIFCFHPSHLRLSDLGWAIWRPSLASITAAATLFGVGQFLATNLPVFLGLVIDFLLYLVFYMLVWSVLPNGVRALRELLGIASELRQVPANKEQVVDTTEYDA